MSGAEIRIPMRSSDTEVQDQMRKLRTQVEMLTGKLRESGQVSRQASRTAKEGFQEMGAAGQQLTRQLDAIKNAFLGMFSIEVIRRFVNDIIQESKRLSQAADQSAMGMQRMLSATGFGADATSIVPQIRGMQTPMTESERAQVFGAIAGAAPMLSHQEVMALARPVIERGGAVHAGDAGVATQFGQAAADIFAGGGFTVREAVDAAAFMHGRQGEQGAAETARQMAGMLRDIDPGLDPRAAQGMAFGFVQASLDAGFNARDARSALDAYVSARTRVGDQGEQEALAMGMDPESAARFGRARMQQMDASEFERIMFEGTDEERIRFLGRGGRVPFRRAAFEDARAGVMDPSGTLARMVVTPEAAAAMRRGEAGAAADIAQEQHRGFWRGYAELYGETRDRMREESPGVPSWLRNLSAFGGALTVQGEAERARRFGNLTGGVPVSRRPDDYIPGFGSASGIDVNIRIDNQGFFNDQDELSTPN